MAETRVFGNRYEIQSLLGTGGMASVYLATDRVLDRPVAVKVLSRQFASDATFVERFRREAQAAAALNHPNVVSVFDTGSDGDIQYIVMEYVQGRTLCRHHPGRGAAASRTRRGDRRRRRRRVVLRPSRRSGAPGHQARQRDDHRPPAT